MIADTIADPVSNGPRIAREPDVAPGQSTAQGATGGRPAAGVFAAKPAGADCTATRFATVALVAYLIALGASNTAHVKVDWRRQTPRPP